MVQLKSVLMVNRKNFEFFNTNFLKYMKKNHNTNFSIITNNRENESIKSAGINRNDNILVLQELEENASKSFGENKHEAIYNKARFYENKYKITYLRDSFMQDRNVALKYLNSYKKHPGSNGDIPKLINITHEQNYYFEYFEKFYEDKKIDLVISRPDSMIGFALTSIAKEKNIPVTFQLPTRSEGYIFWPYGAYNSEDQFKKYLIDKKLNGKVPSNKHEPFWADTNAQKIIMDSLLLKTLINDIIFIFKDRINWLYKDFKRGKLGKRVSIISKIKFKIKAYLDNKFFNKLFETDLDIITSKPFVYFPLPMEPEYNTHSLAKEFINIHAMIQQSAISLPSGYNLVLKEHKPNIGLKDRDFYLGLMKLPNIIFAHYNIPGPNLVKEAKSIITISGTTALEAAELGKKAVIFGSSIEYMHLSNIIIAHSMRNLPSALQESIQELTIKQREEVLFEINFLKESYKDLGFYAPNTPAFQGKLNHIEDDQVKKAVKLLIDLCDFQLENYNSKKGS